LGSASRTGSVGGPPARRDDALVWPLPEDGEERDRPRPGAEVVPADHDWELYLLELGAPRRMGLRAGARLVSFMGLGLAVAATGWINIVGRYRAPDARPRLVDGILMWAFGITGTLLATVSFILLVMAVVEARPWSRLRRRA
jgi:hypothetical protein